MSEVSQIIVYPIKGFAGEQVEQVAINRYGNLKNDRISWVEVDGEPRGAIVNGKWANQTGNKNFWQIHTNAVLSSPSVPVTPLIIKQRGTFNGILTTLHSSFSWEISNFLSTTLGLSVQIRFSEAAAKQDNPVRCFSIISEESLRTIADWFNLEINSLVKRLRPNLIVSGLEAFEEYSKVGTTFNVGQKTFKIGGLIPRCSVPACHPETGEKTKGFEKEFSKKMMEHIQTKVPADYLSEYRHGYYASVFAQLVSSNGESEDSFIEIGDRLL